MTIGCVLAVIGFTMYTHAKIAAFCAMPVEPLRPVDQKQAQDEAAVSHSRTAHAELQRCVCSGAPAAGNSALVM